MQSVEAAIIGPALGYVYAFACCGPLVAGVLADMTGDYKTGFTVLALIAASGPVLFLSARKPLHPKNSKCGVNV